MTKLTKIQVADKIIESVLNSDPEIARPHLSENFISHRSSGFINKEDFLKNVKQYHIKEINVVRAFENENHLVLHSTLDGSPIGKSVRITIFRFDKANQIVEQWIATTPQTPKNGAGYTQTDGYTKIEDLAETANNEKLVLTASKNLLGKPFGSGGASAFAAFDENFIEHNEFINEPKLSGTINAFKKLAAEKILLQINKIHFSVAQGNFIFVLQEGELGGKPFRFFDIFRIKNHKIIEHWDVIDQIKGN